MISQSQNSDSKFSAAISAGRQVFQRRGYANASADEIAREAGFAVGTLYNLFGNKEKLYFNVAIDIGGEIMRELERMQYLQRGYPERALEELISFRMKNQSRHRLFFENFNSDFKRRDAIPCKELSRLSQLHYAYRSWIEELFINGINNGCFANVNPGHAAFCLEAILNADREIPPTGNTPEAGFITPSNIIAFFSRTLMPGRSAAQERNSIGKREIFITQFDFARLRELLKVARSFNPDVSVRYLNMLEAALERANITNSESIPPDVVTMNSRVQLTQAQHEPQTHALVFPADKDKAPENLSILSPLGAAILGFPTGTSVDADGQRWTIGKILYQPEAAGDFHL